MSRQTDRQLQRIHGQTGTPLTPLTVTDTSSASGALSANTTYIFVCTKDCHFIVAETPVATTNHTFLAKGVPWPITILADGTTYKVAAIQSEEAGTFTITPMLGVHA